MRRIFSRSKALPVACVAAAAMAPLAIAYQQGGDLLRDILKRAEEAERKIRYVGTRRVMFRRGPRTFEHTEYVTRLGERLRIEFTSGSPFAGQVIVEDGRERRHFFPAENEIRVTPPRRGESLRRLMMAVRGKDGEVRVVADGSGEIAGQTTREFVLRDPAGNVLQRVSVDARTGVLLRRQVFDQVGTEVGTYQYTEIDYRARIEPSVFRIERKGATVVTPQGLVRRFARQHGLPQVFLGPRSGYRLESARMLNLENFQVMAQAYTKEGSRLTLFLTRQTPDPARLERFTRGKANAETRRVGDVTLVLIGNLPGPALSRLLGDARVQD